MTQSFLRLIKRNPAIIIFTFSLILLAEYLVLRVEGRVRDADTVGKQVCVTLVVGCLTYFSASLLNIRKEAVERRIVLRIPVYIIREASKNQIEKLPTYARKFGQLCIFLPVLFFILSLIFFFLFNDPRGAASMFNATCLLLPVAAIVQLSRPMTPTQRRRLIIRVPVYIIRERFTRDRIRAYLWENPGAPFILGFQFLLILCALLLVKGAETMANDLAVYAYYALVVGVLLQLVSYIREGRKAS